MSSFTKEFKEFITRGSVMDLAVGVIIGGTFQSIVNSLVKDVVNPLIAAIIKQFVGQSNLAGLEVAVNGQSITYGNFIGAIINFFLTALVVFIMIRCINSMRRRSDEIKKKLGIEIEEEKKPRKCPFCLQVVDDDATRCPHCTSELPLEDAETKAEAAAEATADVKAEAESKEVK